MTTIVWNPKNGEVTSDMRAVWDGGGYSDTCDKVFQFSDGIIAFSGCVGVVSDFKRLHLRQHLTFDTLIDMPEFRQLCAEYHTSFDAFIVRKHPDDFYILYQLIVPGFFAEIDVEKFYGIGTGAQYAIGALCMGAAGEEAIEIASKYDYGTSPSSVTYIL